MDRESPDWHLREWLVHFDKKQAALSNELGWNKQKAHHVWHGLQEYRRETVNEVARWLGIEPFELLMRPNEALALRGLRNMAAQIVGQAEPPTPPKPTPKPASTHRRRTGTGG